MPESIAMLDGPAPIVRVKNRQPEAVYRYQKQWRNERAQGHRRIVPVEPVLERVRALREIGWSLHGIAKATGVAVQVLHLVEKGEKTMVHRDTEQAIMKVRAKDIFKCVKPEAMVPIIGARRRLQALLSIGWRHTDIAPLVGFATSNLTLPQTHSITRTKHDAMVRVYDELWDKPGPSRVTIERAVRAGYLPPLAWDDDTIDDPTHSPVLDVGQGERRESTQRAFAEEIEFLHSTGATREEMCARLGAVWITLERSLLKHGRGELIAKIPTR